MKSLIKTYWKTLLFFALMGLIGGFCTGLYLMDSYPADIQQELLNELAAGGLGAYPADITIADSIIPSTAVEQAPYNPKYGISKSKSPYDEPTH